MLLITMLRDSPGGPVVKHPPADAADAGLILVKELRPTGLRATELVGSPAAEPADSSEVPRATVEAGRSQMNKL